MVKLAGFPMYDFPEIRPATDAFWTALHDELVARGVDDVPISLTRPHDLPAFWRDRSLLLGQTCGYPLMIGLCGPARYVATPCYTTRFTDGPQHKSVLIVNRMSGIRTLADARGTRCAINMADSNTGMNLLRLEVAKQKPRTPFFARVDETLAHRKSMLAVAKGDADLASIDCVTFAHVEKIDPALAHELRIIGETETAPALPFITSPDTDDATLAALQEALQSVVTHPRHRPVMQRLLLDDIRVLSSDAYERVREIEDTAIALGYPELK